MFLVLVLGTFGTMIAELSVGTAAQKQIQEETLQQKIERLSNKYQVSAVLASEIIRCESRFVETATRLNKRVDSETGAEYVWSKDIGYWQLNTYWQEETMNKMGWDIYAPEDNLEAGFWLLKTSGTKPWNWSKWCWGHTLNEVT